MKKITLILGALIFISSLTFSQNFTLLSKKNCKAVIPVSLTQKVLTTTCDTTYPASFMQGTCYDSITDYVPDQVLPYDSGVWTGQNGAYHFSELAMKYPGVSGGTVSDVMVWYAEKAGTTGTTTCKIYTVAASKPNTLLGTSAAIAKSAIDTSGYGINSHNIYHFSTPVSVGTKFFVSITIPTTFTSGTDELGIWDENIACSAIDATDSAAYLKYSTSWLPFVQVFSGSEIDMMIMPIICTTTGVQNYTPNNFISIYPNPSNSIINVVSDKNIESIKIINTIGQTVFEQNIGSNHTQINTADFNSGIYFVQVKNNDGITTKSIQVLK